MPDELLGPEDALDILGRTPAILNAWLANAPDSSIHVPEGAWSARRILGHLILGERTDWIPRAEIIVSDQRDRPFAVFERETGLDDVDQEPLSGLLGSFSLLRERSLERLRTMVRDPANWMKTGRHPVLGTVTFGQLIAAWVVHDRTHLAQLARLQARALRADLGPWAHPDFFPRLLHD